MFTVSPDEAAKIQAAYHARGEPAAIDVMRQLFPALRNSEVGALTRIIATWSLDAWISPEPT